MFVSHSHQYISIAVPRTGSRNFSATLKKHIVDTGLVGDNDHYIDHTDFLSGKTLPGLPSNPNDMLSFLGITTPSSTNEVQGAIFFNSGNMVFANRIKMYVMQHHLTPKNIIDAGIATVDNFRSYQSVGFVRDPIQRWLSHAALRYRVHTGANLSDDSAADYLIKYIRANKQFPLVENAMKKYFFYNDEMVVTPYLLSDILTVADNLVSLAGGATVTSVEEVRVGSQTEGNWANATTPAICSTPVADWLPQDCIDILNTNLADDIQFYNDVVAGNV